MNEPFHTSGDGGGLITNGVSYNRVMWISAVSCRKMLPDPAFFIECLKGAWEELLAAADALPSLNSTPPKKPVTIRKTQLKKEI